MKRLVVCTLGLAAALVSAADAPSPLPVWLVEKIAAYERLPPFNPPRSITQVTHAGQPAYLVSAACCDIPSELYDARGRLLCHPDGGFAGGDGRCPSFTRSAPELPVWRDRRGVGAASAPR